MEKQTNFFKKHKVMLVLTAAVIAAAVAAVSIVLGVKASRVRKYLDGKIFEGYDNESGLSAWLNVYAFEGDKIAMETWKGDGEVSGDISEFMKCRISPSLFLNKIKIKAKYPDGWKTVATVALGSEGNVNIYSTERDFNNWYETTKDEVDKDRKIRQCIEHNFGAPVVEYEAVSCSQPGREKMVCTNCGYEKVSLIRIPHNYVNGICTVCGAEEPPAETSDASSDLSEPEPAAPKFE